MHHLAGYSPGSHTRTPASTRRGDPLRPESKVGYLHALRRLLADYQDWELGIIRFDPRRTLAPPRSLRTQLGPSPRVLADDVWAKLLWASTCRRRICRPIP